MKRLFRKNQIIITSLAIMIVIAGYLNFTADQTKPVKQEAAAETAEKIREENIQAEEAAAGAEADITSFPDEDLASVSAEAESTADTETPEGEKVGEAVSMTTSRRGMTGSSAKKRASRWNSDIVYLVKGPRGRPAQPSGRPGRMAPYIVERGRIPSACGKSGCFPPFRSCDSLPGGRPRQGATGSSRRERLHAVRPCRKPG